MKTTVWVPGGEDHSPPPTPSCGRGVLTGGGGGDVRGISHPPSQGELDTCQELEPVRPGPVPAGPGAPGGQLTLGSPVQAGLLSPEGSLLLR